MNEDQLNALTGWKHDELYCTCPQTQVRGNKPEEKSVCSKENIVKCAKEDNPALNKMFQRQDIKITDIDEVYILFI